MLILLSSFVYCQPPHWKLGGNPAGGVDGMGVTTNFLGSALGNNIPIRLGTDGITRMFIQANSGLNPGYIGIGSTNPLFRLHIDASATPDATSLGWKKGLLLSGSAALMWEGSPITGFNYFMQLGYTLAPNIGYVNATNAASISLVTIFAILLFKDEFSIKKLVGILGVTAGLLLLLV